MAKSGINCVVGTVCAEDEYEENGDCKECSEAFSAIFMGGSLMSFLLVALYIRHIHTSRTKMIRVKVLSTFFQVSDLTTMTNIQWPSIALSSIPLTLPVAHTKCLASASGSGWTFQHTFYLYIYAPLLIFGVILAIARSYPKKSPNHHKAASVLTFLLTLWYSPVLKAILPIHGCVSDAEGNTVLSSDAAVSCEPSFERTLLLLHSFLIVGLVGVGFPVYVVVAVKRLQRKDALDANATISALFKWYSSEAPWFEAVHLIRKAGLIMAGALIEDAIFQAGVQAFVNLTFVFLLLYLKPLYFFPCSTLKGWGFGDRNLFLFSEGSAAFIAAAGSILALIGALLTSNVTNIGTGFAAANIAFALLFLLFYYLEIENISDTKVMVEMVSALSSSKREDGLHASTKLRLGNVLLKLEQEWSDALLLLKQATTDAAKERHIAGLPYLHSQFILSMKEKLHSLNTAAKTDDKEQDNKLKDYERLLLRLEFDYQRVTQGKITAFNKLRIVWSFVRREMTAKRLKTDDEHIFFDEVCEKRFDDTNYISEYLKQGRDKENLSTDDVVKHYLTSTGLRPLKKGQLTSFVELLCVSNGFYQTQYECVRLGKQLSEKELQHETKQSKITRHTATKINGLRKEIEENGWKDSGNAGSLRDWLVGGTTTTGRRMRNISTCGSGTLCQWLGMKTKSSIKVTPTAGHDNGSGESIAKKSIKTDHTRQAEYVLAGLRYGGLQEEKVKGKSPKVKEVEGGPVDLLVGLRYGGGAGEGRGPLEVNGARRSTERGVDILAGLRYGGRAGGGRGPLEANGARWSTEGGGGVKIFAGLR